MQQSESDLIIILSIHVTSSRPVIVPGSVDEEEEEKKEAWLSGGGGRGGLYVDEFLDIDAPFNCRLSLKDFDTLIHDLDRELAKQINICL